MDGTELLKCSSSLVSEKVVVFTFGIVLWELDLSTHLKIY